MIEVSFKNVKLTSKGKHVASYECEAVKGNATIKSTIVVCLEDAEIELTEPFDMIIAKGKEIAKREYQNR